jgi:AraC-like DNA-binding protein
MHLFTKFDTTIVPPSDRFGYWHDVVCGRFVPASSLDKSQNDFDASLVTRAVGPLEISHFRAPPHFWSREKKHISADDHDDILLSILLSGSGALEQDGRTVVQRPHEIVLYDTSQAFRYDLASEIVLVKIPRRLLASRYTNLRSLMAVGVRTDLSLNALLMDLATRTMLLDVPSDSSTTVGARLASSVLDLVSAVIDLEIEERGALSHQRMSQLERAQRYAVANLGDENLSPEAMAKRGAVSLRTLNRLFAKIGTTPMRWVWQRRLQASHSALSEGCATSVTDAAFQFGFSEVSHFSRSFKAAYGVSPEHLLKSRNHA